MGRITDEQMRRLQWRCRRGMLENDLVLQKFLGIHGRDLDQAELATLNDLLEVDDNQLWDIFSGRIAPPEARFIELVDRLRAC
jgi:antitoxin CptB